MNITIIVCDYTTLLFVCFIYLYIFLFQINQVKVKYMSAARQTLTLDDILSFNISQMDPADPEYSLLW